LVIRMWQYKQRINVQVTVLV